MKSSLDTSFLLPDMPELESGSDSSPHPREPADLEKENFELKLQLYHLNEELPNVFSDNTERELFETNVKLKSRLGVTEKMFNDTKTLTQQQDKIIADLEQRIFDIEDSEMLQRMTNNGGDNTTPMHIKSETSKLGLSAGATIENPMPMHSILMENCDLKNTVSQMETLDCDRNNTIYELNEKIDELEKQLENNDTNYRIELEMTENEWQTKLDTTMEQLSHQTIAKTQLQITEQKMQNIQSDISVLSQQLSDSKAENDELRRIETQNQSIIESLRNDNSSLRQSLLENTEKLTTEQQTNALQKQSLSQQIDSQTTKNDDLQLRNKELQRKLDKYHESHVSEMEQSEISLNAQKKKLTMDFETRSQLLDKQWKQKFDAMMEQMTQQKSLLEQKLKVTQKDNQSQFIQTKVRIDELQTTLHRKMEENEQTTQQLSIELIRKQSLETELLQTQKLLKENETQSKSGNSQLEYLKSQNQRLLKDNKQLNDRQKQQIKTISEQNNHLESATHLIQRLQNETEIISKNNTQIQSLQTILIQVWESLQLLPNQTNNDNSSETTAELLFVNTEESLTQFHKHLQNRLQYLSDLDSIYKDSLVTIEQSWHSKMEPLQQFVSQFENRINEMWTKLETVITVLNYPQSTDTESSSEVSAHNPDYIKLTQNIRKRKRQQPRLLPQSPPHLNRALMAAPPLITSQHTPTMTPTVSQIRRTKRLDYYLSQNQPKTMVSASSDDCDSNKENAKRSVLGDMDAIKNRSHSLFNEMDKIYDRFQHKYPQFQL